MYGTQYEYEESEGLSSTSSTTLQTKLTLTTGNLPSGTYRIGYSWELSNASNGVLSEVGVQQDSSTIALCTFEADNDFHSLGGFKHVTLSGVHTFTIKYRVQSSGTCQIRRARMEFWRID